MRLKTEEEMRQIRKDSVREDSVERYFLSQAKRYRCMQRKNATYMGLGAEGWPDRVIVWPDGRGTADWIELKRPKGGRAETKQPQVQADLRAQGARVEVLHTRETIDAYFRARSKELGVKPVAASKGRLKRGGGVLEVHEFIGRLRSGDDDE